MNVTTVVFLLVMALAGIGMSLVSRIRVIGLLVITACCLATAFFWWQARQHRVAFADVRNGDVEQEIVELMGSPDRATDGTVSVYGGPKRRIELTPGCTREIWYVATLTPEQWAICFDKNGLVVDKFHYASY